MNRRRYALKIQGMQCADCANVIEEAVLAFPGMLKAHASFTDELLIIEIDTDSLTLKTVREAVKSAGYDTVISVSTNRPPFRWRITLVLLAALGILLLFQSEDLIPLDISLEKIGKNADLSLIFLIGFLSSFHCIGMCGGFVVSYAASGAKSGHNPHISHLGYGLGKTLSYTAFGAAFGYVGGAISFSLTTRSMAMLCAGIFLVVYGLGMLDSFRALRRFQIHLPRSFVHALAVKRSHTSNPCIIGLLNGLMIACGPLQAMYVLAAGTGKPLQGAIFLAVFSLGTLPVLFALGYLSSLISANTTRSFLKISSVIVIVLGASMINRSQVILGTGYDFNSWRVMTIAKLKTQLADVPYTSTEEVATLQQDYQVVYTEVMKNAYLPAEYVLRKGVPVKWIINVKQLSTCNREIVVPALNLTIDLRMGLQMVEFTPENAGTLPWSCYMGMIPGTFVIRE